MCKDGVIESWSLGDFKKRVKEIKDDLKDMSRKGYNGSRITN